jgi:hypothetical protein
MGAAFACNAVELESDRIAFDQLGNPLDAITQAELLDTPDHVGHVRGRGPESTEIGEDFDLLTGESEGGFSQVVHESSHLVRVNESFENELDHHRLLINLYLEHGACLPPKETKEDTIMEAPSIKATASLLRSQA